MSIVRRLCLLAVIAGLGLLLVHGASSVQAQTAVLSEQQVSLIRKNCQSVKSTLNQLHASDALLRVNRGQVYESLSTRLMETFTARLGNNGLDNKATNTISGNYRVALDTFRAQYRLYEQRLAAAIKIDCQASPVAFHEAVEDARAKRKEVHTSVQRLHRIIDDYRSAVDDFLMNYEEGR